jgi:phospholipid/cholesterol/gamma-HCH transport system substrate-binding protein
MEHRRHEMLLGLAFVIGIVALFAYTIRSLTHADAGASAPYRVTATFADVGGLRPGAPVTVAGVRIGRVAAIAIDRATLTARSTLEIFGEHDNLPRDSKARILTSGLVGQQYIALAPGRHTLALRDGDRIGDTRPAMALENLIGQLLAGDARSSAAN